MNKQQFEQLTNEGYDCNLLFLISLSKEELASLDGSKVKAWVQTCIRKGLLTEGLLITVSGLQLLSKYKDGEKDIMDICLEKKEEDINESFEKWWEVFPSSDYFVYKGMVFEGSRAMKINKTKGTPSNCKTNFNKIVNEGKYTGEDVIRATEFHINVAKEQSFKQKINKLSFLAASERYLRERMFAPYVELSRNYKPKEETKTETFI